MNTKVLGDLSSTNFAAKTSKHNMHQRSNPKLVGDKGENMACEYLVKKGYKILARNYTITYGKKKIFGEIDIIAKKKWRFFNFGKTIHFIEVKTITGGEKNFFPEEKVDWLKKNKLRKLCLIWLDKNKFSQSYPYQIDVIGILMNNNNGKAKIDYFKNSVEDI